MRGIRYSPSADDGLLVSFDSIEFEELHALADEVRSLGGVAATIAGHASVLVLGRDSSAPEAIRAAIEALLARGLAPRASSVARCHRLVVDFRAEYAPDLALLLERAGMSLDELLDRIGSMQLRARYLGFLPGFAYLEGLPAEWSLPRRSAVRERVPAGSLGLAGAMVGFYPGESPGGWNLIGRTGTTLWDPRAARPNLIAAGDIVTIEPGEMGPTLIADSEDAPSGEPLADVLAPGIATFVTGEADVERYAFGIAPGGAFDSPAMRLANRLVGNAGAAPVLECAALGPRIRVLRDASVAITGASAGATLDGTPVPMRTRIAIGAGSMLDVGHVRDGMRAIVAFRGGLVDASPRWSARPRRLTRGDTLCGAGADESRLPLAPGPAGDRLRIAAYAGPHEVDARLLDHLAGREWTVLPSLDRTGVRLAAGAPPSDLPSLLPSCGMRLGTVQWHPGGELVVMGPDHPITGGYLQPLTVPRRESWKIAQLAPGDRVRFEIEKQVKGHRS